METTTLKLYLKKEHAKLKQKLASLIDDDPLLEEGGQEELSARYKSIFFRVDEEFDRINSSI